MPSPGDRSSTAGDATLEQLADRYARLIRSVVRRVGGPSAEGSADDVGQEILLALWRRGAEQAIAHPTSYLYRAAVRETIRLLRHARSRAEEPIDPDRDERDTAVGAGAPGADPENGVRAREVREAIDGCLACLGTERAQAVRAHLAGFEAREIMALHGWPYQKTRNLVARGMADLRRCLEARGMNDRR